MTRPRPDNLLRALVIRQLDRIRRDGRPVLFPDPHQMGLGNLLYLWLRATKLRQLGEDAFVLRHPSMDTWLPHFPAMAELVIDRSEVRFTDRRILGSPQDFLHDVTGPWLSKFIDQYILSAPQMGPADLRELVDPETVVINVRRGDYYSKPAVRGIYGFDIDAYVRSAVAMAAEQRPIRDFLVVSDGLDWCRARLGWLADHAPVRWSDEYPRTPMSDFRTLAAAQRLVLANSTFSYWGGYVSNALHDNAESIIAPWFHARTIEWGRAYQLDPRWQLVREIPGGWDS